LLAKELAERGKPKALALRPKKRGPFHRVPRSEE
jgi:hypothetical protein